MLQRLIACFAMAGLVLAFAGGIARGAVIQITMELVGYSPAHVSAQAGDTVEWVNKDIFVHSATARSGEWDPVIPPDEKKSVTLKSPGEIEYYCRYHPTWLGRSRFRNDRALHKSERASSQGRARVRRACHTEAARAVAPGCALTILCG